MAEIPRKKLMNRRNNKTYQTKILKSDCLNQRPKMSIKNYKMHENGPIKEEDDNSSTLILSTTSSPEFKKVLLSFTLTWR